MVMSNSDESGPPRGRVRKAELVCPTCGRTAPLGDWTVSERDAEGRNEVTYGCPECSTVVVAQPMFGRSEPAHPA